MSRLDYIVDYCSKIDTVRKVYVQPPESVRMVYPCIRITLDSERVQHADNVKYHRRDRYTLTIIDKKPDSTIRDEVSKLDYCSFDRTYQADNLNHFVFTIF